MCGIFVAHSKTNELNINKCRSSFMQLDHRGPDYSFELYFQDERLFLGQTILSITGKPDIELVERMDTLNQIIETTTKPIIIDGDTGGRTEHFPFTIRTLERLGVSAIIIEDKIGFKRDLAKK